MKNQLGKMKKMRYNKLVGIFLVVVMSRSNTYHLNKNMLLYLYKLSGGHEHEAP